MFYANNLPEANKSILELFVLGGLGILVLCFAIALTWELWYKIGVIRLRRFHCRGVVCKDLFQCSSKLYRGEVSFRSCVSSSALYPNTSRTCIQIACSLFLIVVEMLAARPMNNAGNRCVRREGYP